MRLNLDETYVLRRKLTHTAGIILIPIIWIFNELFGLLNASMFAVAIIMFLMAIYVYYELLKISFGSSVKTLSAAWRKVGSPEFYGADEYWGACWLGIGLGVGVLLGSLTFDINLIYVMVCAVSLGDGFSGVVGVLFGKHKWNFNRRKSVEGTVAGFLLAFLGASLITRDPLLSSVGCFTGMLTEVLPWRASDNATVPIITMVALITMKILGGI
jgi:dolichol kinase